MPSIEQSFNDPRFVPGSPAGHYESWFVRANHPQRPLGVWLRYTIFVPRRRPDEAVGELWAIWFDGETGRHAAAKSELPIANCRFGSAPLQVRIGNSTLTETELDGAAGNRPGSSQIRWELQVNGGDSPLFLLPEAFYDKPLPKAKVLTGRPGALVSGRLWVDGTEIVLDGWRGSHNHNWGSQHTDRYAWGQVAGFDSDPEAFLEIATAQIRIGRWLTPAMTPLVLRLQDREYRLNQPQYSFRRASYTYFDWNFHASSPEVRIQGRIHAPREDFVCLRYNNPPGGWKHCLNSKIAHAELSVIRPGDPEPLRLLASRHAAFEILTDDDKHGLVPRV